MKRYKTTLLNEKTTCYTKEQIKKLSFLNQKDISIKELLETEIPEKDRVFAVGVLLANELTTKKLYEDFKFPFIEIPLTRALHILYLRFPKEVIKYLLKF